MHFEISVFYEYISSIHIRHMFMSQLRILLHSPQSLYSLLDLSIMSFYTFDELNFINSGLALSCEFYS